MSEKTVLVTGANKGIGFEVARQLGKNKFHVVISARSEEKLKEAWKKLKDDGISSEMLLMDVSSAQSIKNAAELFAKRNLQLDVLVNNAAILLKEDQSIVCQDIVILKNTIETNCYGVLLVTQAFLPYMKSPGRIVNMSSSGGSMNDPVGGWSPAYCISKSMLNAMTRHLAHELAGKNIAVNTLDPGWVRTDMGGGAAPRPVEKGAETPVWLASEAPQNISGRFFRDKMVIPW